MSINGIIYLKLPPIHAIHTVELFENMASVIPPADNSTCSLYQTYKLSFQINYSKNWLIFLHECMNTFTYPNWNAKRAYFTVFFWSLTEVYCLIFLRAFRSEKCRPWRRKNRGDSHLNTFFLWTFCMFWIICRDSYLCRVGEFSTKKWFKNLLTLSF